MWQIDVQGQPEAAAFLVAQGMESEGRGCSRSRRGQGRLRRRERGAPAPSWSLGGFEPQGLGREALGSRGRQLGL